MNRLPRNPVEARPDTYLELVRRLPLASIRTAAQSRAAQAMIDELLPMDLDDGASKYLDALSDLLILHERDSHPIAPLAPDRLLANLLEDRAMSQADLVRATGFAKATVSDLVAGKRAFTVPQMQSVARVFGIPAHLFLPVA